MFVNTTNISTKFKLERKYTVEPKNRQNMAKKPKTFSGATPPNPQFSKSILYLLPFIASAQDGYQIDF